jgi:NitT/TauT family transport system permease protein
MRTRAVRFFTQWLPGLIFLVFWESATLNQQRWRFLFASPSLVIKAFLLDVSKGTLLGDLGITAFESICGLLLGSALGSALGLALWLSPMGARISRPYIAAIASIPTFALAPMTIIWFGTGLSSKVMMAMLATFFVAVSEAYEGAKRADAEMISLVQSFGGTRGQALQYVVIPASIVWIVVSCRLNVGFSILGAFVGEFIVSERGIGHYILRSSGLYDVPRVLVGVLCLMFLSAILLLIVRFIERRTLPWLYEYEQLEA